MEQAIRIEDNFEDVLNKAMAGLRLRKRDLCEQTNLPRERIVSLLAGHANREDLLAVAGVLELHGPSLVRLAEGTHRPPPLSVSGLLMYTTPFPVPGYEEMTVNSFLVVDFEHKLAVAFDSGANVDRMLADIREAELHLEMVLVTHAHGDHVVAMETLTKATGNPPVWLNERESLEGANSFREGKHFTAGSLSIESRLTHGHSPGGTTFVISGLERPVAIVGDSLFCYSQGGAPGAYRQALDNNRRQILSLPDNTVVCPGHGPMTTVAEEKAHNPFYPDFK
jgi:glyoxylase-like metal-dependent hydrolase (beta-lactamase superfamily II)